MGEFLRKGCPEIGAHGHGTGSADREPWYRYGTSTYRSEQNAKVS
jgi:hypothetical protein